MVSPTYLPARARSGRTGLIGPHSPTCPPLRALARCDGTIGAHRSALSNLVVHGLDRLQAPVPVLALGYCRDGELDLFQASDGPVGVVLEAHCRPV